MGGTLVDRLAGVDTTSLADADKSLRILPLSIRPIVLGRKLVGRAVTARANADLMSVIDGLAASEAGDVLVVDAGDDEHAVAGELFASEAQRRGLAGIVIHGRCRDSRTLATMDLPVFATGVAPSAYPAVRVPEIGVELSLSGVAVRPGDLVVGDDDGLIVGSVDELSAAIDAAEAIQFREVALRDRIQGGATLFDALNYDEHVAALRAGRPSGLAFSDTALS